MAITSVMCKQNQCGLFGVLQTDAEVIVRRT